MNKIDLEGRVAIVTGAARGIGYAIAERLKASGAQVALWDVDAAAVGVAGKQLEGFTQTVDVTQEAQVAAAVQAVHKQFGKIDILVNNAGIGGPIVNTWEYDLATFQKIFDVNVVGVFLGCKHVIPLMKTRNYGRIVNTASIAGKNGTANFSAYGASKAAVIALTKALGRELADTEILVNCITPGPADTDSLNQFTPEKVKWMIDQVPKGRFLKVEEVAAMVAWLSSDDCSFSTGAVFDITGGRSVY
jgi:2-dehydro-3-deoxy-L-rhamnonate dehydrogenase (NAD+)